MTIRETRKEDEKIRLIPALSDYDFENDSALTGVEQIASDLNQSVPGRKALRNFTRSVLKRCLIGGMPERFC